MRLRSLVVMLLLSSVASCSLLEKLTEQQFVVHGDLKIDTNRMEFPKWSLPSAPCASAADCCPASAEMAECAAFAPMLACTETVCSARVTLTAPAPHYKVDVKELAPFQQAKSLADVRIESLVLTIRENTLSFDLPSLSIYIAPIEVKDPTHAGAKLIGTLPMILKREVTEVEVEFTKDGQEVLGTFLGQAGSPFNVILGVSLGLSAGEQATGILSSQVTLTAKARAQL